MSKSGIEIEVVSIYMSLSQFFKLRKPGYSTAFTNMQQGDITGRDLVTARSYKHTHMIP